MPMLSGSAGSERSHVSSMSGSACFSACLRSFSASRSSSRVLNLSVSAFFVLMGFGGSCGDGDGKGHWTSVAGYGEVFTTTELFDVTAARDHFDGTVEAGECRFCAFDARNREHHARNAGRLF